MSNLKEKLQEIEDLNLLSLKDWLEIFSSNELSIEDIEENYSPFMGVIQEYFIEDNAFNGFSDEEGGEINFTEIAKSPGERLALIEKVIDLNRRLIDDKKAQKINSDKELILRSQIELLLKDPEQKERYDFISFMQEGSEVFGIVREQIDYSGKNFSSIIPFFKTDNENTDLLKLLRNQESILIPTEKIIKSLPQEQGMQVWKDLIKKEEVNPELEIGSKIKDIISPKVEKALTQNNFSLKKLFDDSLRETQSILKGAGRNATFEDCFNEIFVCIKKSESFKMKKISSAVYKMFQPILEDEGKSLQQRMNAMINVINDEKKMEDLKFIDDFSHKFKHGELTDEDIIGLIKKYEDNKDISISNIVSEFVETKKQEIKLNGIGTTDVENKLSFHLEKINVKDIISFEDNGRFYKGRVLENNDGILKIQVGEKEKITTEDKSVKLFKGQKFTHTEIIAAFEKSNIQLKFEELSNESKLNLLKGDFSQLITSTVIKDDHNGFKKSEQYDFKLCIKYDENRKAILKPVYKNQNFNLDEFTYKNQKLNEDQKKDLLDQKVILFEVVDKDGNLQFKTDMKYDPQLNDILYNSNKGENYAKSLKEGYTKQFTATTTIIDKGSTGIKI